MKVFVLTLGQDSDLRVCAVFSDLNTAKQAAVLHTALGDYAEVLEFELDEWNLDKYEEEET